MIASEIMSDISIPMLFSRHLAFRSRYFLQQNFSLDMAGEKSISSVRIIHFPRRQQVQKCARISQILHFFENHLLSDHLQLALHELRRSVSSNDSVVIQQSSIQVLSQDGSHSGKQITLVGNQMKMAIR